MKDIATLAMDFIDKYRDPALVDEQFKNNIHYSIEFGRELERLLILLGLRIGRVERTVSGI